MAYLTELSQETTSSLVQNINGGIVRVIDRNNSNSNPSRIPIPFSLHPVTTPLRTCHTWIKDIDHRSSFSGPTKLTAMGNTEINSLVLKVELVKKKILHWSHPQISIRTLLFFLPSEIETWGNLRAWAFFSGNTHSWNSYRVVYHKVRSKLSWMWWWWWWWGGVVPGV